MLAAITSYFNLCNYKNQEENYIRFLETFKNVPLFTIELSYNNNWISSDSIQLSGTENNIMWQKERLLNILLESIPPEYDKIAWIDADILFENPQWHLETESKLNDVQVVQLYQNAIDVDKNLKPIRSGESYCYSKTSPVVSMSRPGFAWAAQRSVLQNGLYDGAIIGIADLMMIKAWEGEFVNPISKYINEAWRKHWLKWSVNAYKSVRGKMGYINGTCLHLYHGNMKNREYINRLEILKKASYDPETYIELDDNKLWRWRTEDETIKEDVKNYFFSRKEDD